MKSGRFNTFCTSIYYFSSLFSFSEYLLSIIFSSLFFFLARVKTNQFNLKWSLAWNQTILVAAPLQKVNVMKPEPCLTHTVTWAALKSLRCQSTLLRTCSINKLQSWTPLVNNKLLTFFWENDWILPVGFWGGGGGAGIQLQTLGN